MIFVIMTMALCHPEVGDNVLLILVTGIKFNGDFQLLQFNGTLGCEIALLFVGYCLGIGCWLKPFGIALQICVVSVSPSYEMCCLKVGGSCYSFSVVFQSMYWRWDDLDSYLVVYIFGVHASTIFHILH